MKQNRIKQLIAMCMAPLLFVSCLADETLVCEKDQEITIHVSVKDKDVQTRASDLIAVEKIKRYDIFIYNTSDGQLINYFGQTGLSLTDGFTKQFPSTIDYQTPKDVFVVVNYDGWNGKTTEEMKTISRENLKATEMTCTQNYEGNKSTMTSFGGYRKTDGTGDEPFIMSVSEENFNFSTASGMKLDLSLKRNYAKVVLNIVSSLPDNEDNTDWGSLKSLYVKRINNIPTTARMFPFVVTSFTPAKDDYEWGASHEYTKDGGDADLKAGYEFDTFLEENLKLRIFPHTPAANTDRTKIAVGFSVGPKGNPKITKEFFREIEIGSADTYRIMPNSAYIITVRYGKTDSSLSITTEVVPWYIVNVDNEVYPE